MKTKQTKRKTLNKLEKRMQNQDFPNIPSASENSIPTEINKKEIAKHSKLHDDGRTENDHEDFPAMKQ